MTPGPWSLRDFGHREHGGVYVVGARGEWGFPTICEMPMQPNGEPCADAQSDGRLIAAAPDLLSVAHLVVQATTGNIPPGIVQFAREAIKKAEGGA